MKGIASVLELLLTGIILILAFLHFFPQYSIRTNWDSALLELSVKDTLNTIDRLNKTYDFSIMACQGSEFETFMNKTFSPVYSDEAYVWWKEVENLDDQGGISCRVPYFTKGKKETIVDVVVIDDTFYVYSFTLGLGYPY